MANIKGKIQGLPQSCWAEIYQWTNQKLAVVVNHDQHPDGTFLFDFPDSDVKQEWTSLEIHLPDGSKVFTPSFHTSKNPIFELRGNEVILTGYEGDENSGGEEPNIGNYPDITSLEKQFTKGTFTAAISYYGMLGAPLDRIKRDLDKARRAGFGHARVWVDWEKDRSPNSRLTNRDGSLIEEKAKLLDNVLAFCQQIGMSLDLTFETAHYDSVKVSGEGYKIEAHKKAVRNVLTRWGNHPCVKIVDVDNEAESRGPGGHGSPDEDGKGHTSAGRFAELMAVARSIHHKCLVSCSISGDGEIYKNRGEGQECIFRSAKGDILLPHMERKSGWGAADGPKCKALSQAVGLPVYSQEPARNNYKGQNWPVSEFENLFKSTKANGVLGACFHTGAGFDVSQKDMFDQFDNVEKQVIANLYSWIK